MNMKPDFLANYLDDLFKSGKTSDEIMDSVSDAMTKAYQKHEEEVRAEEAHKKREAEEKKKAEELAVKKNDWADMIAKSFADFIEEFYPEFNDVNLTGKDVINIVETAIETSKLFGELQINLKDVESILKEPTSKLFKFKW